MASAFNSGLPVLFIICFQRMRKPCPMYDCIYRLADTDEAIRLGKVSMMNFGASFLPGCFLLSCQAANMDLAALQSLCQVCAYKSCTPCDE